DITTRQIPDYEFRTIYRDVLSNLKEAKRVVAEETSIESSAEEKNNKTAVTEILSVFAFQREVDIFGNVPYSQALDIENINPAYDEDQAIYAALFTKLDAAIALIDVGAGGFPEGDLVYHGDMNSWKKFAYSLKLKLAINAADVSALDPAGKAADAVTGGVFTSSADNALFSYLSTAPNTNQVWVELVNSGRFDWVPANTIVDTMNGLSDPRRPLYFEENLGAGVFIGGNYGDNNIYDDYSHITPTIQEPDYPGILMTYSEIQFYLAEAAARGWSVGGSAETFYIAGITASIVDDWQGDPADAASYILGPALYPSGGSQVEQWAAIGLQSWLASYNRGLIGWTTYRRLDTPDLKTPAITGNEIPRRYTYPVLEQTLNGTNYSNAAGAMGGDLQANRIFWDLP
ncbi:MAG TPA: SusD/RagB family nutrient-binding outer membrane lipoprotein, partial [Bacteroidia bacterium]|nr:SusD/RagB family nutrient-binding outer membrane lipoprotein [Bacteroidia bacterium]